MYVCVSHEMHPSMGACGWLSQFSSAKQNCSSTIPLSLRNAEMPIQPFATGTISAEFYQAYKLCDLREVTLPL